MSSEVPPQIWIDPQDADESNFEWYEHDREGSIKYVPTSALSDAWDTAIKTLIRAADECPVFVYHSARGREFLIEALEAARDAALSAGKCATSEEVGHGSV